jgi:hypothetical protein
MIPRPTEEILSPSPAPLKVWHCHYSNRYNDIHVIVLAEIQSKALGIAVQEFKDTSPDCWSASEIETSHEGLTYISDHCY